MFRPGNAQHITQYSDAVIINNVFGAAKEAGIDIETLAFRPFMLDQNKMIAGADLLEVKDGGLLSPPKASSEEPQSDSQRAMRSLKSIVAPNKIRIQSFTFGLSPNSPGSLTVTRGKSGSGIDTIQMDAGTNIADSVLQSLILFSEALETRMLFKTPSDLLDKYIGEDLQNHFNARGETLARLESVMTDLVYKLADSRRQQEEELLQKTAVELERLREAEARSLDEIALEKSRFDEERSEAERILMARESVIDIRESKIVRRDIRLTMQKMIAARLKGEVLEIHAKGDSLDPSAPSDSPKSKPGEVSQKSGTFTRGLLGVHGMSLALLVLFGTGFWWSSLTTKWDMPTDGKSGTAAAATTATNWDRIFSIYGPRFFFTMGFSVTATFYLRLLNQDYQKRNKEEERLRRLALDIDRASWVVESALEWKTETSDNEPLPTELTQVLAKGLFENADGPYEATHPSESVERFLFGNLARAKVNLPNGNEIELERPTDKKNRTQLADRKR